MNYSETYFELDSEEAAHCHHCHLICCAYIKGLVNTKDQSNACMCEMMSKGLKEALTVLIVTHCFWIENQLNIKKVMSKNDYEPLQHILEGPEATLYRVCFRPF